SNSDDEEINKLFNQPRGNKIGVIFYGAEGYLVQKSYNHCIVYDKQFKVVKEFKGGGDHFGNFVDACQTRDSSKLNADAWEGHLSAGVSHLGNISYYLGEQNHVSANEAERILSGVKGQDDNQATLERTIKHLVKNGVDLGKYPISMGPMLKFDPEREIFPESSAATSLLTRNYREGFVCPKADRV
ncbi:gfo/Idh/MocA family oxidoreductase, partial [Verrucomicrobia bacterium]|nr:gfo/Idh/MocA family oxidoreductase [Verrucomicrobiota bacterium]